jgi:hypothetical protein
MASPFTLRGVSSPSSAPSSVPLAGLLEGLPAASASAPVVLSRVAVEGAYVVAYGADGSRRRCRPGVASSVLEVPLTAALIAARLELRVGTKVVFVAANGWSASEWFVACTAA